MGDVTNLAGALLTKQATWQVLLAGYYVVVDVVLLSQFLWYSYYKPWRELKILESSGGRGTEDVVSSGGILDGISPTYSGSDTSSPLDSPHTRDNGKPSKSRPVPFGDFHFPRYGSSSGEKGKNSNSSNPNTHQIRYTSPSPAPSPKALLLISMLLAVLTNGSPPPTHSPIVISSPLQEPRTEVVGRLLSWTSTILYLASRLPQIYKNHRRRSTAGLSPGLFIAAFFGNLFYSSSILVNPLAWSSCEPFGFHGWAPADGNDQKAWVSRALPFWLGSAGVLALDAAVGVQFLVFGERKEESLVVKVKDDGGKGHWRKVSGWMRGWVPGPTVKTEREDEERLLVRETAEDGRREGRMGYDTI